MIEPKVITELGRCRDGGEWPARFRTANAFCGCAQRRTAGRQTPAPTAVGWPVEALKVKGRENGKQKIYFRLNSQKRTLTSVLEK